MYSWCFRFLFFHRKVWYTEWLDQAFFAKDTDGLHYHELCLYFLMDISDTDLFERGSIFTQLEGNLSHTFEWLTFDQLKDESFYPAFLKEKIFDLPNKFTIRSDFL